MTALFTALAPPRDRNLLILLALTSLAVIVVARRTAAPPSAEPEPALVTITDTATITETEEPAGCGVLVAFARVRYGDRFGLVVPCIDLYRADGLRFAVGDMHTLHLDAQARVTSIIWQDKTWQVGSRPYEPVKTPASAIGHIHWTIEGSVAKPHVRYQALNWSWDADATAK